MSAECASDKNIEYWSISGADMNKSEVAHFLWPTVYKLRYRHITSEQYITTTINLKAKIVQNTSRLHPKTDKPKNEQTRKMSQRLKDLT